MSLPAYEVLERVGEGSFGRVHRGRRRFTGQFVALKFVAKAGKTAAELAALYATRNTFRSDKGKLAEIDRQMDEFARLRGLGWAVRVLGTDRIIAAGHPFGLLPLAEDERVEDAAADGFSRDHAAAALVEGG